MRFSVFTQGAAEADFVSGVERLVLDSGFHIGPNLCKLVRRRECRTGF